jgi:hypothetical protein
MTLKVPRNQVHRACVHTFVLATGYSANESLRRTLASVSSSCVYWCNLLFRGTTTGIVDVTADVTARSTVRKPRSVSALRGSWLNRLTDQAASRLARRSLADHKNCRDRAGDACGDRTIGLDERQPAIRCGFVRSIEGARLDLRPNIRTDQSVAALKITPHSWRLFTGRHKNGTTSPLISLREGGTAHAYAARCCG